MRKKRYFWLTTSQNREKKKKINEKNIHCNNNNWKKQEEKMKNKQIKKLIKLRGKAKTWVGTVISFIQEGIFFFIYLIVIIVQVINTF